MPANSNTPPIITSPELAMIKKSLDKKLESMGFDLEMPEIMNLFLDAAFAAGEISGMNASRDSLMKIFKNGLET